ncbi:MAG TPA: peptidylprolyl isomerase [Anaerolineales bacterium]|nr:peptidylprolyl isomerase [Anaerolineales bacterium]
MFSPRLKKLTTIILLAYGLAACSRPSGPSAAPTLEATSTPEAPTATPVPAAATVNGEIVPLAEYQAELARYQFAQAALGKSVGEADAAQAVLDDMIAQTLLAQGARAAGLSVTEAGLQSRIDALAASLGGTDKLAAWQSAHGYDEVSFRAALKRAAEAASMRDKIIAEMPGTFEQVHVRQILLYNEANAQDILAQLKAGGKFDDLAATVDPVTRGDLGWFPQGYLLDANLDAAAFVLQPGQFSDVIVTEVGFHIIYVIERGPRPLSPEARLVFQSRAVAEWVNERRAQASIVLSP